MGLARKLFGPSREEIWRQLSSDIGAQYVEGSFSKADKVQAIHGEWTVTLDNYVVSTGKAVIVYTRFRAPYVNPDGFRFTIYRKGLLSEFAKRLGMQDIEIGDEAFDRAFIIKATDENRVRALLSNTRVQELITAQPEIELTVKDDEGWFGPHFPDGVDELRFTVVGTLKDVERLKAVYELFGETLDQLCRIGSAYGGDPKVTL